MAPTLVPSTSTTTTFVCSTTTVSPSLHAATHTVDVGALGALRFEPDQITANVGDIVLFNFLSSNHTLTQSAYDQPCSNPGRFNTDFHQHNPRNQSGVFLVSYLVTDANPQWFQCAQNSSISHCESGMVFGLNTAGLMTGFVNNTAPRRTNNTDVPTSPSFIANPTQVGGLPNNTTRSSTIIPLISNDGTLLLPTSWIMTLSLVGTLLIGRVVSD